LTQTVPKNVLVIGYGNPAREDDGIGPAAVEIIGKYGIDGITVDANYQPTVEDAAALAQHDYVVFIDASMTGEEPFTFSRLHPKHQMRFSSHSVEPEEVLWLAQDLFNARTEAYILGVRGYSFSMFTENMTEKASENLKKALDFLVPVLKTKFFRAAAHSYNTDMPSLYHTS